MPRPKASPYDTVTEAEVPTRTTVPVQRLQTIGEVSIGDGDRNPATVALQIIGDLIDQDGYANGSGEYRFDLEGMSLRVTVEENQ